MFTSEQGRIFSYNDLINLSLKYKIMYPDLIKVYSLNLDEISDTFFIKIGYGKKFLITYCRENSALSIVSMTMMEIIDFYCKLYRSHLISDGIDTFNLLTNYSIYFFPAYEFSSKEEIIKYFKNENMIDSYQFPKSSCNDLYNLDYIDYLFNKNRLDILNNLNTQNRKDNI